MIIITHSEQNQQFYDKSDRHPVIHSVSSNAWHTVSDFFGQILTSRPNQESLDAFQAWSLHPWCACSASSDKISCSWTHGTIICIMMTYHVKILDIMLFIYGAFIELIACKLVLSTNKGHSDLDLGSAPWCSHMHLPYSYSLESEVRSLWCNEPRCCLENLEIL